MRRAALILVALLLAGAGSAADSVAPAPWPQQVVRWLQEYLQINTTNPPGNEREAALYLAGILESAGIPSQLLTSPEGRTSLYARWAAPGSNGRALALVHHLDVVPAEGAWQEPPFSGRWRGDVIWGRGALDVKSLGIAQLAAMISLHREGVALARDLIYLAVADEEAGGKQGAAWLLAAHPELFTGLEAVLNEGGNNRALGGRLIYWGVEVTQKRPLWLRVQAQGRGGHGSQLNPSSAAHQLIRGLARLVERPPRYRVTAAARQYLEALERVEGRPNGLSRRLDAVIRESGPTEPLPPGLPGLFLDTVQVTTLQASRGPNIITDEAAAGIDIRLLPDTDGEAFLRAVREALGPELAVEVVLESPVVAASPTDHPLFLTLERVLAVRAPVIPVFVAGTTDSRYFRAHGIPAYGFSPFGIDALDLGGIHAKDERMSATELTRGVEVLRRVLLAYPGAG